MRSSTLARAPVSARQLAVRDPSHSKNWLSTVPETGLTTTRSRNGTLDVQIASADIESAAAPVVQGSRAGLLSRQFVAFGVVGELGLEATQRVLDASGHDPQVGLETGQRRRQRAEVFVLRLAADLLADRHRSHRADRTPHCERLAIAARRARSVAVVVAVVVFKTGLVDVRVLVRRLAVAFRAAVLVLVLGVLVLVTGVGMAVDDIVVAMFVLVFG